MRWVSSREGAIVGLIIDLHLHTRLHSSCSQIDPDALIRTAIRAGLDGIVITEHHYQWRTDDIDALKKRSGEPHFLVLAAFEYASRQGDILIYGLEPSEADTMKPGMPPEEAVAYAHRLGGVCIAAHPTRAGMGYDDRIGQLGLDAIETASVNLQEHEQRLAAQLAITTSLRPVNASDAHRLVDVGRYGTEFADPIHTIKDLRDAIQRGRFRPAIYTEA